MSDGFYIAIACGPALAAAASATASLQSENGRNFAERRAVERAPATSIALAKHLRNVAAC